MKERQFFLNYGLHVSPLGDAGPLLDNHAKKEYKQGLGDLEAELEEAQECNDFKRAEQLEEERDALTKRTCCRLWSRWSNLKGFRS